MSPNEFGVKIIGLKKLFGQKKLDQKKCESKTFLGPTDLSLNFGSNWIGIFYYIQIRTNVAWTKVHGTNVSKKVDKSYIYRLIIKFG